MATVADNDISDEELTIVKEHPDDQFLLDLFTMQTRLEQRRKETLEAWIEFLDWAEPKPTETKEEEEPDPRQYPETD